MGRNACSRALLWKCMTLRRAVPVVDPTVARRLPAKIPSNPAPHERERRENRADESVSAIYSAPDCDLTAHGRNFVGGGGGVPAASRIRAAPGGLSDNPGAHL